jgi:membrane-bound lytic murein transglycosylase B
VKALLVAASLLAAAPPRPDAPLPREPVAIASALERTTARLNRAIDEWQAADGADGATPEPVTLWALRQQRLFLVLTYRPRIGDRTRPLLSAQAKATLDARRRLVSLTPPTTKAPASFPTGPPEHAALLLRHYREAQRRFGVPWHVLAAINFVESGFGRIRSASSAGAQGPMQFLPATWRAYGLGGDVHEPRDAILGAANYLRASGAPRNLRAALFAYNRSTRYVDAVVRFSDQMKRDRRIFFAYHAWQVFVKTPSGPRRITGP